MATSGPLRRVLSPPHSLCISTASCPSYRPPLRFLVPVLSPATVPPHGRFRSLTSTSNSNFTQTTTDRIWHHLCTPKRPSPSPTALAAVRSFHNQPPRQRDHHFDTLKLVERLQREGFTEEQAVAMMNALSDIIEESVQNLTRTMVSQAEQEKITYTQKVDFAQLRSDLQAHHSTEYQATRAEYERLSSEIAKLNSRLREEIIRAQNSVKLDLNLEKGRIREEASVHELKIKETDTRIETEVGMIRGTLETVKFSTLQWLIGVCTGTAALILGVWRLLA